MKKIFLIAAVFLSSCTLYTEKQSEALSQNVYATNDSLDTGRVDLAYYYAKESNRLVKPPKNQIKISAVYQAGTVVKDSKNGEKTRVILVPPEYNNNKVIVVGSNEYSELLKEKEINKQITQDNFNLKKVQENTTNELIKQKNMADKMVNDLNKLQKEIYKKDLAILWRNIIIVTLVGLIGVYFYAKMNGLFFL